MSPAVDSINKYREPENENEHQQPVNGFSEHIVLLTIVALQVLNGMTTMLAGYRLLNTESMLLHTYYTTCGIPGTVVGAIAMSFLSDVYGRKTIFILLATISIIISIFLAAPSNNALTLINFSIQAVFGGGANAVLFLTITEYCSPKHRFTYLIASVTAWDVGYGSPQYLFMIAEPKPVSVFLKVFMIVLGLACLGSACVWPESPYWLAARGRRGEAACTLRRLRGARAEPELSQLRHERRSPGPARLYWRPLLVVLVIASIFTLNEFLEIAKVAYFDPMQKEYIYTIATSMPQLVSLGAVIGGLSLIAVMSYFVKRKTVYITCCGVAIALNYVIGFWMCITATQDRSFQIIVFISNILRTWGLKCLSVTLFTEIVPYKYNTHISCVRFIYMSILLHIEGLIFRIDISNYVHILVLLTDTLSVVGLILFFWLAPETKDRTLFEIQKSQAPQYIVTCPEENQTMMENI